MPGGDPREAAAIVNGELDLAHLVELPGRGVGADMVGRMAAILVDMPMDAGTWGYRLSGRRSAVSRRAADFCRRILMPSKSFGMRRDSSEPGVRSRFRCAAVRLPPPPNFPNGHKILRDRGAWSDVIASSTEGIRTLAGETERRLGSNTVVQLDEPMIGAVIDGTVKAADPIRHHSRDPGDRGRRRAGADGRGDRTARHPAQLRRGALGPDGPASGCGALVRYHLVDR